MSLDELLTAEFKEAFDEFDKVCEVDLKCEILFLQYLGLTKLQHNTIQSKGSLPSFKYKTKLPRFHLQTIVKI